ncbi:MAG: ATP synthase F0 subunit B [Cyanobacteria bacterium P01_H01_bin.74]
MSSYSKSHFPKLIERMEDYVLTGMGIPFTPFTVVNGERLVPLLDRIRDCLPEEIAQAQNVLSQREQIVTEAQEHSKKMIENARKQAEEILSESELLRAIHEEAYRVREQITAELEAMRKKAFEEAEFARVQALEESQAIRQGADHYAEAILGSLDEKLKEFHTVVRNGKRHLEKARLIDRNAHAGPSVMVNNTRNPRSASIREQAPQDIPTALDQLYFESRNTKQESVL